MKRLIRALVLGVCSMSFAASSSWAALTFYTEDFESLDASDPLALGGENLGEGAGFIVWADVWQGEVDVGFQRYAYGPFPAPNGGPGFSIIGGGEGGPEQGLQGLGVYTDYDNNDHLPDGPSNCGSLAPGYCIINTSVFQERTISSENIGSVWTFTGDYKSHYPGEGIADPTSNATASAFLVTLDPTLGYAATNNLRFDTTEASKTEWRSFSMTIDLSDPALEGQLLQFGLNTRATNFEPNAVVYDNFEFSAIPVPAAAWLFGSALGLLGWMRRKAS